MGSFQTIRIGWVTGPIIPATIEGEKPGLFTFEVGAETKLLIVKCKVNDAAAEFKQFLARVAIKFLLLNRIGHGLFGEIVLQL